LILVRHVQHLPLPHGDHMVNELGHFGVRVEEPDPEQAAAQGIVRPGQ
jgi:hypothetical protein